MGSYAGAQCREVVQPPIVAKSNQYLHSWAPSDKTTRGQNAKGKVAESGSALSMAKANISPCSEQTQIRQLFPWHFDHVTSLALFNDVVVISRCIAERLPISTKSRQYTFMGCPHEIDIRYHDHCIEEGQ
eukprot:scaffold131_cov174-Ochromonas_danica.AAC.6